jgi:hypothetical protein
LDAHAREGKRGLSKCDANDDDDARRRCPRARSRHRLHRRGLRPPRCARALAASGPSATTAGMSAAARSRRPAVRRIALVVRCDRYRDWNSATYISDAHEVARARRTLDFYATQRLRRRGRGRIIAGAKQTRLRSADVRAHLRLAHSLVLFL